MKLRCDAGAIRKPLAEARWRSVIVKESGAGRMYLLNNFNWAIEIDPCSLPWAA